MAHDAKPLHVFLCAGEASGDMHAASVMRALKQQVQGVRISGVAGQAMRDEGCVQVEAMESLNVMGIGDVLKALPRIRRLARRLLSWLDEERPDVVVLVDFPGFNMRLGEKIRALGIPVLYYIAPKLWAWGRWRVKRLARAQDRLACILPFEPDWFATHDIAATYVGNPSAFSCQRGMTKTALKQHLGLSSDQKLLALLPGSRRSELERHTPLLLETYQQLKARCPDMQAVTTRAPSVSDAQMQPWYDAGVHVLDRLQEDYAMRADAALAVSGTATLELALWHTPTILVYQTSAYTMWLGRKLLGLRCVGLANIILDDRMCMPELLQEDAQVPTMVHMTQKLFHHGSPEAATQEQAFQQLEARLGLDNPAERVALMIQEMA